MPAADGFVPPAAGAFAPRAADALGPREADVFVPLAAWLAAPPCHPERRFAERTDVEGPPTAAPIAPSPADNAEPPPPKSAPEPQAREALRDLRLFRARLAEALERATAALVRDLAYAVLGRELRLAPADVATLAARILAEHPAAQPVAIRHAPGDALPAGLAGIVDPALAPGDLVVTFATGEVDARLGTRLAAVLEAWS